MIFQREKLVPNNTKDFALQVSPLKYNNFASHSIVRKNNRVQVPVPVRIIALGNPRSFFSSFFPEAIDQIGRAHV